MKQILILLLFFSLSAQESNEPFCPAYSGCFQIANVNGDPTAIVGGCVNVITGDFFDTQRDLYMVGGEPLVLERSYCSSDFSMGGLSNGWHFNLQGMINNYTWKGPHGREVSYQQDGKINPEILHKGLANNASGLLSGKTNLKNSALSYQTEICIVRNSDFSHSNFTKIENDLFALTSDVKPNGMRLHYNYCKRGLSSALVANARGECQQSITFAYPDNNSDRPPDHLLVYANDGRIVQYCFEQFRYPGNVYKAYHGPKDGLFFSEPEGASEGSRVKKREKQEAQQPEPPQPPPEEGLHPRFYLSKVVRPNGPTEHYIYEQKNTQDKHFERLTHKVLPDNRFLKIDYYKRVDGLPQGHPWIGKVKMLQGPIGSTAAALPIYSFHYDCEGFCHVQNAMGHRTDYYWDHDKRLKKVVKNGSLINDLYWGGGCDYGNLYARVCSDLTGPLFCKCYRYDDSGNVLNEWLYGNLSGHNSAPLIIGDNGIPIETGCERFEKKYTYSNDLKNLLLVEEEGNKAKRYRYYPNTDLLEAVFTLEDENIVLRNGYSYDESCVLVEEILDDGISANLSDLTGASFRKIKRITPKKTHPFGVPEVIEEYCQDLAINKEYLSKKVLNTYSIEGRLIRQDYYDSECRYAYTLEWEYDAYGNITKEIDALGNTTFRQFDANSNLIFEQGPRGDVYKQFYYDYCNRLLRADEVHPDRILTTQYRYDLLGRRTATIDCYGNETNYEFDAFDRVTKIIGPEGFNGRPVRENVYDSLGNLVHAIDAMGNTTYTSYNVRGQPKVIVYPDGSSEHFSYYLHGPLAGKVERNGCSFHYRYDYQDRLIETKCCDPNNNLLWKTSATYNALNILTETDRAGNVTYYEYDIYGRKVSILRGSHKEEYQYDSLHRLIKTITYYGDAFHEMIVKTCCYDAANRVIQESTEDSSGKILTETKYGYDALGRRTQIIQGASFNEIHYDSYGIPTETIDSLGNVTRTIQSFTHRNAYDQLVACQEVIDPLGNSTIIIKDTRGRDVEHLRKNALGEVTQKREVFYDHNGNKTKVVETIFLPESSYQVAHIWQYDCMNRAIRCIEACGMPEQKTTSYTFNQIGQLIQIHKPSGVVIHHVYSPEGLLVKLLSSDQTVHYTFSYDANQNLIESHDIVNNTVTKRSYDIYNQVIEEKLGNDLILQFDYDAIGRMVNLSLPDNSSLAYSYQGVLLKEIHRNSSSGGKLYTHSYDLFDALLNPVKQTFLGNAGTLAQTFDKKGRTQLIQSQFTEESYIYDAADNLISRSQTDGVGKNDASYSYDDLYQITEERGVDCHSYRFDSNHNRIAKDNCLSEFNYLNQIMDAGYLYDEDGRLIQSPDCVYRYDALDRLISLSSDEVKATYTYDSFNRRLTKTINGQTWRYLYADQNDIGCFFKDQMIEFRALGLGHGAEIGASVAIELDGIPYAPVHDLNGNITALISQKGKLADTYRYTAFGEEKTSPKTANPWRFSSKRCDDESSLIYFGRRYYSPSLSRWLTPDPLSYQAGPNLYAYVSNNPLTSIDLYGLRECRTMPSAIFVKDIISKASDYISEALSTASDTISHVKDKVSEVSEKITTVAESVCSSIKTFSDTYLIGNLHQKTSIGYYPGVVDYPDGADIIFLILGQCNDAGSCDMKAETLSNLHGGVPIPHVKNCTYGLLGDTLKSFEMKIGFSNFRSVRIAADMITKYLESSGRDMTIYVESQGAITFACALKYIPNDLHKRISVYAFGGGTILPKNDLKKCINYWCNFDPVTPFTSPLGILSCLLNPKNYELEILQGERLLPYHNFSNGPYFQQEYTLGKNYIRKCFFNNSE